MVLLLRSGRLIRDPSTCRVGEKEGVRELGSNCGEDAGIRCAKVFHGPVEKWSLGIINSKRIICARRPNIKRYGYIEILWLLRRRLNEITDRIISDAVVETDAKRAAVVVYKVLGNLVARECHERRDARRDIAWEFNVQRRVGRNVTLGRNPQPAQSCQKQLPGSNHLKSHSS